MVSTILLSGVYTQLDNSVEGTLLRHNGEVIDPEKLFLRKDYDSAEAFAVFPVNYDGCEHMSLIKTDCCTSITLMSILERNGFTFEWNNLALFSNGPGRETLAATLKAEAATVSLSTSFIITEPELDRVIGFIREHAPDKKIILGGPLLELNPDFAAKADYAVIGEGELTYPALLKAILEGLPVDAIPGVAYRKDDQAVVFTEPATYLDLDSCPPLNWKLSRYQDPKSRQIYYEASRSCPFKCKFCTYHLRGKFRFKSAAKIFEDWKYFIEECNVNYISIFDSVFSSPRERLKELCRLIIEAKLPVNWECWVRATDLQEQEFTDLMARAGCKMVSFGLESAAEPVLESMNKKVTTQQIKIAVNNLVSSNIILLATLMVGFPGETPETVQTTTEFLINSKIPVYRTKEFQIRDLKMPILNPEERRKYGIKIGGECAAIPESYVGEYGPYWTTDTMTLTEAVDLQTKMIKEVALKGSILCANFIDFRNIRKIFMNLNRSFVYQALKTFEKIMALSLEPDAHEAELKATWDLFLNHYAIYR